MRAKMTTFYGGPGFLLLSKFHRTSGFRITFRFRPNTIPKEGRTMLPLAVFYGRMSKGEQTASIQEQRTRVYPYFQGKYEILEEYLDEGKSGSKDTKRRVAFLRMIRDLTEGKYKGKVRCIVCLDTSRFGRLDTIEGAEYKKALRNAKVKLETVTDGEIDWNSATGRIIDSVKSEGNHDLSIKIASKGLGGRIRVTKEGKPNQVTPYAMAKQVTSPTGEKIVVKRGQPFRTPKLWTSVFVPGDEAEVKAIQFAFTEYRANDISYNELAYRMSEKGFPSPTGDGWRSDTLTWMLQNPVYVGDLRIGQTSKGKFYRVSGAQEKPLSEIDETPASPLRRLDMAVFCRNAHEGIIDRELYEAVQRKIKAKLKTRSHVHRHGAYSLSGIIHCGNCGKPMYGSKNEKGKTIYRCHRQEVDRCKPCRYWIAYEAEILPYLLTEFFGQIRETIQSETQIETIPLDDELRQLKKEIAKLDKQIKQGAERFLTCPAELCKAVREKLTEWEADKKELQRKLNAKVGTDRTTRLLEWWDGYHKEFFGSNPVDIGADPDVGMGENDFLLLPDNDGTKEGRKQAALRTINSGLIAFSHQDGTVTICKTSVPAAVLREKLKRIETKVSVWFKAKTKGRGYDMDKVRIEANIGFEEVCFEYAAKAAS
jgi:site-specific DNA recombinase